MSSRLPLLSLLLLAAALRGADPRDLLNSGYPLPNEGYCDQPYIVETRDGNLLCVETTGRGAEGGPEQHVISTISRDGGKTWDPPVDIEPAGGRQASWATPLVTPSGRVYVFYNYNGDHLSDPNRKLKPKGPPLRTDVMGWFVFKFSDDHGHSWSHERYRIPLRQLAHDFENEWKGKYQNFWSIDKPSVIGGAVVIGMTRMGLFHGERSEVGWVLRSKNVLTERDPAKIQWDNLPDGDRGIWTKAIGPVQQEHNLVGLSNGDFYCVFRNRTGSPATTISRDAGHTWSEAAPTTYTPGGRRLKTPTACPQLWQLKDGRYLFWYHNNSFQERDKSVGVGPRNLGWLSGGVEKNGTIVWSQPELVAYFSGDNHHRGFSYPDIVERNGEYFLSATAKEDARFQRLEKALIEGLWQQDASNTPASNGLLLAMRPATEGGGKVALPRVPDVSQGGSFAIELWVKPDLAVGQVLLDSREPGRGFAVVVGEKATLQLQVSDGTTKFMAETDQGMLTAGKPHHVVFIVDGGPKMISSIVDGQVCNGGAASDFGWTRFYAPQDRKRNATGPDLGDINGGATMKLATDLEGLRLYNRYLRTTEAIGNYHAGLASIK